MSRKIAIEIICALFVLLFFYAAMSKLVSYEKFVGQIGKSPLLTAYAEWMAVFIPILEIILSIALAFPKFRSVGMYGSFGLMVLFSLYIAAILSFSTTLPCSCGGILNALGWKSHLLFNVFFSCLGLLGIILLYQEEKIYRNN